MSKDNTQNLISFDEVINLAKLKGVNFGKGDPYNRLRYYIKIGLLPKASRKSFNGLPPAGALPIGTVDQLVEIDAGIKSGKNIQTIIKETKGLQISPNLVETEPTTINIPSSIPETASNFPSQTQEIQPQITDINTNLGQTSTKFPPFGKLAWLNSSKLLNSEPKLIGASILSGLVIFLGIVGLTSLLPHNTSKGNNSHLAEVNPTNLPALSIPGSTLGSTTQEGFFAVNVPTDIKAKLTAGGGISTNNSNIDAGSGTLTASNVIYTITAGQNVTVSGDKQNPVISAAAAVANINGTGNRIIVTGSQIDIAGNYAGQTSLTTLGTVTSGVWQASPIGVAYLNAGSCPSAQFVTAINSSLTCASSPGSPISISDGVNPAFAADNVNFVNNFTVTNTGLNTGSVDLNNTTVAAGSYGNAASVATFTVDAKGRLTAANTTPIAISAAAITTGTLAVARGGTGVTTFGGANTILYTSATNTLTSLAANSGSVQCLTQASSGTPAWGSCGGISGITVQETDGSPSVATATTIQFGPPVDSSPEFQVTDQGGGVARVRLGTKVVLTDATQTLTNKTIAAPGNTITGLTNSNLSGTAGISNANLANSSITIGNGAGIAGGATVALGGTVTLSVDQSFSPTWTGQHTFSPSGTNNTIFNGDNDSNSQFSSIFTGTGPSQSVVSIGLTDNATAAGISYLLNLTNNDNGANVGVPTALIHAANANAAETVANGLFLEQTGTGTLTNAITIKQTAGAITNLLKYDNTVNTALLNIAALTVSPTYTLPNASGTLAVSGNLGDALQYSANLFDIKLGTSGGASTANFSGLQKISANGLSLLSCADTQILKKSGTNWACGTDNVGSGTVSGAGTQYTLAMFSNLAGDSVGNSIVTQNPTATTVTVGGSLVANDLKLTGLTTAGVVTNTSAGVLGTLAGTTTTLLHGNAAGLPTYSAVALTADVSGTLPVANGGTNNSAAIGGAGSIVYSDGTKYAYGGTTVSAGQCLLSGTSGTGQPTWGSCGVAAGGITVKDSVPNQVTSVATLNFSSLFTVSPNGGTGTANITVANNSLSNAQIQAGNFSNITGVGTLASLAVSSTAVSGNIVTVDDQAFNTTGANLASLTFKNANSTATATTVSGLSITPTGGTNAFVGANTLNAINLPNVTAVANNTFNALTVGTGYNSALVVGGTPIINGSGVVQSAGINGSYTNLTGTGTLTAGATGAGFIIALGTSTVSGTLGVANGGTGATSLTANGVLIGNGTSAVTAATGTAGLCLISNGASAPTFQSCGAGAAGITVNSLTNISNEQFSALFTVTGGSGTANITVANNSLDFAQLKTALTLFGNTSIAQAGNTWSQTYTNATNGNSQFSLTPTENLAATGTTNGLTITPTLGGTAAANTYTLNAINLANVAGTCPAGATCTNNGIQFGTGLTNYLNGTNFTVTSGGAISAVGVNSGSGIIQGTGGLTITGTGNINATGTAATNIGNSTGVLTIASGGTSGWTNTSGNLTITTATSGNTVIDSAGVLQLGITNSTGTSLGKAATTLTVNPTSWTTTPTISGLITATSGLTSNGTLTVSANQNLTMASGTGLFSQTYSNTSGTAASFSVTDSASTGTTAVNGLGITLVGTNNALGSNTITGLNFANATTATNNTINGITFGTGFTNFLTSPTINVSAAGAITGATGLSSSGTIVFSGLATGVVINTSGTLASEAQLATSRGGLGANVTAAGGGEILYSTTATTYGHLATAGVTDVGKCLKSGGTAAPSWGTCATGANSPFASSGGIITKDVAFANNKILFQYNATGDSGFVVNTTVAPTVDLAQIDVSNGTVTNGVAALSATIRTATGAGADNSALHAIIGNAPVDANDVINGLEVTGIAQTVASTNQNLIRLTPAASGNTAGSLTGLAIDAITTPNTATENAINIGSGWDNILSGTTAGTNLISFTNFNVTSGGAITVVAGQGLDTIAAGTLGIGVTTANQINIATSGNAPITTGTGLVTTGGSLRVNGTVGLSTTPVSYAGIKLNNTLTGATTQEGIEISSVYGTGATVAGYGLVVNTSTSAALAQPTQIGIVVNNPSLGAGSSITNNYGLYVNNQTSGGSDYGIYVAGADTASLTLASDASTAATGITFGTTSPTNLYRSAASTLKTDGIFIVGNGSGNDNLQFTAEATNPTCSAGLYAVWANSTDTKLKKCQNGTITNLDTGATLTLQNTYNNSATPAAIVLNNTNNGLLFQNPATNGTTSGYLLKLDQLATGVTTANFKTFYGSATGSFDTTAGVLTNYSGYFTNTSTRLAGTNALTNVGLYSTASGAQNNYSAVFDAGNVGIGSLTPATKLEVIDAVGSLPAIHAKNTASLGWGIWSEVTGGGGIAIKGESVGAGTNNYGGFFDVSGATNNYGIYDTLNGISVGTATGVSINPSGTFSGGTAYGVNIGAITDTTGTTNAINIGSGWDNILSGTTAGTNLISFTNFGVTATGAGTLASTLAVNGNALTTTSTSFTLLAGASTTLNIGPTGAAGSIVLSGGSADTGCTLDGTTGNFSCSGNITGAAAGTVGYWNRTGTTLSPATAGDTIAYSIASGSTGLNVTTAAITSGTTTAVAGTTGTVTTAGVQNAFLGTLGAISAGTANGFNLSIATPTGGTINGFNFPAISGGGATVNAVNIGNLTPGAGTETAINIGTGWDAVLSVPDTATINVGSALITQTLNITNPGLGIVAVNLKAGSRLDIATAGSLGIGNVNATTVTVLPLGSQSSGIFTLNLANIPSTGSTASTINIGAGSITSTAAVAQTINIGTGAYTGGNSCPACPVQINIGTGTGNLGVGVTIGSVGLSTGSLTTIKGAETISSIDFGTTFGVTGSGAVTYATSLDMAGTMNIGTVAPTAIALGRAGLTNGITATTGVTTGTGIALTTGTLTTGTAERISSTFGPGAGQSSTGLSLAITDSSSSTGGFNILNIAGFTAGSGTGAKNAVNIGSIASNTGGTATAVNIGSGWDSAVDNAAAGNPLNIGVGNASAASSSVNIAKATTNPLQALTTGAVSCFATGGTNYNMGYNFTPHTNGVITQLGAKTDSTAKVMYLYNQTTSTLLAGPISVAASVNTSTFTYVSITPVAVIPSNTYTVTVYVNGAANYCSAALPTGLTALPATAGNVTINATWYIVNSVAAPPTGWSGPFTTVFYGLADVTFQPYGNNLATGISSSQNGSINLGGSGPAVNAIGYTNITAATTENILNVGTIGATGLIGAAGNLNGINIAALTPGTGTENAINIGSGWDSSLLLQGASSTISVCAVSAGSCTNAASTLVIRNPAGSGLTDASLSVAGRLAIGTTGSLNLVGIYNTGTVTGSPNAYGYYSNPGISGVGTFYNMYLDLPSGTAPSANYGLFVAGGNGTVSNYGISLNGTSAGSTNNFGLYFNSISSSADIGFSTSGSKISAGNSTSPQNLELTNLGSGTAFLRFKTAGGIDTTTAAGTLTIGNGNATTVNIQTGAETGVSTIAIGTGATALNRTINIGTTGSVSGTLTNLLGVSTGSRINFGSQFSVDLLGNIQVLNNAAFDSSTGGSTLSFAPTNATTINFGNSSSITSLKGTYLLNNFANSQTGLAVTIPQGTSGTTNGISITPTNGNSGAVNGINIAALGTAGTGAENAVNIGTGWDLGISSSSDIQLENRADTGAIAGNETKISQATAGTIASGGTAAINSVGVTVVYNGKIYAGTSKTGSAEIYRYDGGTTWTKVSQATAGTIASAGTASIDAVNNLVVYNGYLYAGTAKAASAEVYRYDGGTTWTKVSQATAGTIASGGTATIDEVASMAVYQGNLYVGTDKVNSTEVYRYDGGTTWTKVSQATAGTIASGGTTAISGINIMAVYNGALYAGTFKTAAVEIYRYDGGTTWTKVSQATAGTIASGGTTGIDELFSMQVYNGRLYVGTNLASSGELYRYDGTTNWTKVSAATAGTIATGGTAAINAVNSMAVLNGTLYIGTSKSASAEVYTYTDYSGQSYALRFRAVSNNASVADSTAFPSVGSISFAAGQQVLNSSRTSTQTGSFLFSNGITTAFGGYDVAEDYPTRDDSLKPGDLVSVSPSEGGLVIKTSSASDPTMLGVYSETPALHLSQKDVTIAGARAIPVALVGRVPVKVSTENGPIVPGDPLTSSSTPGVAMKATKTGPIVGKALETYSAASKTGKILVFVQSGWYAQPLASSQQQLTADLIGANLNVGTLTATSITADTIVLGKNITLNRDGKIQIDGQLIVKGSIQLTGDLTINGKVDATSVAANEFKVKSAANDPAATAGSATIVFGTKELIIKTTKVDDKSLVFITPTTQTNQQLAVVQKIAGTSFKVTVPNNAVSDITFNWIIVNQQISQGGN